MPRKPVPALFYGRTSRQNLAHEDKDSQARQKRAVRAYAKAHGYVIEGEYYDPGISGTVSVEARPAFAALLQRIASNGVRIVLVESPDRFARDLTIQLLGHDLLKRLGVTLIPVSAPEFFTEETPTAVMVRQILGAVSEFDKAQTIVKLKAGRARVVARDGKCGGRRTIEQAHPVACLKARELHAQRRSLRAISQKLAEDGLLNENGTPFNPKSVMMMLK